MKFIVFEGLDGSGKSTQMERLRNLIDKQGYKSDFIHFPRVNTPFYGELVARFLRGEFGNIGDLDPYLVALLYAGDRKDASKEIRQSIEKKHYVLVDRYVYSNIAYQCAKLHSQEEKVALKNWIQEFEYNYHGIPKPDLSIFLDVPFDFTKEKLSSGRSGSDRDYLQGRDDIHEIDLSFQERVRREYLKNCGEDLIQVPCFDETGKMLPQDDTFKLIVETLVKHEILRG